MLDLGMILDTLSSIYSAATTLCCAIDKALELEHGQHEQRQALKDLRKAVVSLKYDTTVYNTLLGAMGNNGNPETSGCSPYMRFIQRRDRRDAMETLERTLNATQQLLEEHPEGVCTVTTIYPLTSERRKALNLLLSVLMTDIPLGHHPDLIVDLKDEIYGYQKDNGRAFKLVWNLYVVDRQSTGRRPSVGNTSNVQDRFGQALDSFTHDFRAHPFNISPEQGSRIDLPTFDVLNQNHHELARQIGKAWVDDCIPTIDAQVQELGVLQTSLFELLWSGTLEQLNGQSVSSAGMQPDFDGSPIELERMLQDVIVRSKQQHFTIAFCGMVNSGKSLFLNALMGRAILPTDGRSTAWPCRLRHVKGQKVPKLQFHAEPFLAALMELRTRRYGAKMKTYKPPSDDHVITLSGPPPQPSQEEVTLRVIRNQWRDLHALTCKNLMEFEAPEFELPQMASGKQDVKKLLGQLNDIVRLCQRFGLKFDMSKTDWLLLTIEFTSHEYQMDMSYEFIDLPEIEEDTPPHNFESLVRGISSDSSDIIPIISFDDMPGTGWRRLAELVEHGCDRKANVVICTHLYHISRYDTKPQLMTIAEVFWPNLVNNTTRILSCSSLFGLGANDLLDKSVSDMPPFESIWNEEYIGYRCAQRLLGVGDPENSYVRVLNNQQWVGALKRELKDSGLPAAIQTLTRDMVDRARTNALLNEADGIIRQLRQISSAQERRLLEARRGKDDYDAAKRSYNEVRNQLQAVFDIWDGEENTQIQESYVLIKWASERISQEAYIFVFQGVKRLLQVLGLGDTQSEDRGHGHGPQGASEGEKEGSVVLTVKTVAAAEYFLQWSQRELHSALNILQLQYVTTIRKVGEAAKNKRVKALRDAIEHLNPQLLPQLRDEILDDLGTQFIDIRAVAFQRLRSIIKKTTTRHTAQTAFRAIEQKVSRPWLGSNTPAMSHGEYDLGDDAEVAAQRSIDELGFMFRAPITVLVTLPFVFGLPIWPWMVHSRAYHLEIDVVCNRYKNEIVDPWLKSLEEEGKKSVVGTIELSSKVAKELVTSTLSREDDRYKRELEGKTMPMDVAMVQRLTAMYGNLVAAEEALKALSIRVKDLQTRSGE